MISRRQSLQRIAMVGVGGATVWHASALATNFLDIEQAQKLLLPQASSFTPTTVALDAARLGELVTATQVPVPRGFAPQCWSAMADTRLLGWVFADRVIGKYELIDYAAGFATDGSMTGLEVMAYRESHGAEIRNLAWRKQFVGRKGASQIRLGEDIRNISGATLSCQHVTQGAQRLSALVQLLRPSIAGV